MCGIAGFISKNKTYDPDKIVSEMLDLIRYRGPNQKGVGCYGNVSLGMARLSIIDQKNHKIPYEDSRSTAAIVYNGEIYNHDSIRKDLSGKYLFTTDSDAETALYNFIDKGEASFVEYNGMYAFAIYDKNKNETFIVRDKAGEKPLYYTKGADFFAFASEIKCLLRMVNPEFNNGAISYRAFEFTVGKETLFKNIYSLEPGEYLRVDAEGNFIKKSYWKIWDNLIEINGTAKKTVDRLSDLIEDAVLLRTKNSVHKYGCFISGGVDSALIACISKPDYIYTAHYPYDDFNELRYARLVAKRIRKKLITVKPDKDDFLRTRDKIAFHLDTPCTWTGFSLWMLLESAAKDIKVVLSGEGADEIFSGYHRYHLLHHDEQIYRLEAMKKYDYLITKYYGSPTERYSRLINRCEAKYDRIVDDFIHKTIDYYFSKMNGEILHSMGVNDFYTTMQVLLQMSDRLCMAFGVENRSPFLDYRVIQFGFSMPSEYKIRNGITKWALKEVARRFIPLEIVNRVDKRGFSAPVNRWFGWDKFGKYDRSAYRKMAFEDWSKAFEVVFDDD